MDKKNIVIGGAWPYANSDIHLGHVAGLISGDVLARYFRMKGHNVAFVSGSDCHGTPITERAKKEKKSPKEIAEYYHNRDAEALKKFYFSYDLYTNTDTDYHKKEVMDMFKRMYDNGYIYEKVEPQPYCEKCSKFLSDREIQIICPKCGTETKAEQCDSCQYVPTIQDMSEGICLECGSKTVLKDNKNLYLKLSAFQKEIEEHTEKSNSIWRLNAKNETSKYLKQGLVDRAVTRDLDWGVDIPVEGYEDKKMYVWIEAVLGYITATKKWCEDNGQDWEEFWKNNDNNEIYMVHGKDNIVFHSIIFNALLLAVKENYRLVDTIVSSEYLNINDEKISKSKGNGIPAIEIADMYNPDALRFHLINNGPEKKDSNFTLESFVATNNGELLNKFGNLVNRTLKFKGISTAYDQYFVKGRSFFDNVARLVDELFNDYLRRPGFVEPLAAKFCNGTTAICEGLSQWGSQNLAQQGYNSVEILESYYGDVEIVQNAPIQGITSSYPGTPWSGAPQVPVLSPSRFP